MRFRPWQNYFFFWMLFSLILLSLVFLLTFATWNWVELIVISLGLSLYGAILFYLRIDALGCVELERKGIFLELGKKRLYANNWKSMKYIYVLVFDKKSLLSNSKIAGRKVICFSTKECDFDEKSLRFSSFNTINELKEGMLYVDFTEERYSCLLKYVNEKKLIEIGPFETIGFINMKIKKVK